MRLFEDADLEDLVEDSFFLLFARLGAIPLIIALLENAVWYSSDRSLKSCLVFYDYLQLTKKSVAHQLIPKPVLWEWQLVLCTTTNPAARSEASQHFLNNMQLR